jgi:hypothetical protein
MCVTDLSEAAYKSEERKRKSSFGDFNRSQDRERCRSEENAKAGSFNDLISNIEASWGIRCKRTEEDHADDAKNPGEIVLGAVTIEKQNADSIYNCKRSNCKRSPKNIDTRTDWGGVLDGLEIDGQEV